MSHRDDIALQILSHSGKLEFKGAVAVTRVRALRQLSCLLPFKKTEIAEGVREKMLYRN